MSSVVISAHSGDKINNSELTGVYHHPWLLKFNWGSTSRGNFEIQDNMIFLMVAVSNITEINQLFRYIPHFYIRPFSQSDANSQSDPDSKLRKNTECV